VCTNEARTDLWGGHWVTGGPTRTNSNCSFYPLFFQVSIPIEMTIGPAKMEENTGSTQTLAGKSTPVLLWKCFRPLGLTLSIIGH
jgi:hypothetical protein